MDAPARRPVDARSSWCCAAWSPRSTAAPGWTWSRPTRRPDGLDGRDATWLFLGADDERRLPRAGSSPTRPDRTADPAAHRGRDRPAPTRPRGRRGAPALVEPAPGRQHVAARDAGLGGTAVALAAWHAVAPALPALRDADRRRARAAGCGTARPTDVDHYPRTDPAVIMAVVDADDRLLLGHAAQWPERPVLDARRLRGAGGGPRAGGAPGGRRGGRRRVGEVAYRGQPAVAVPGVAHARRSSRARRRPTSPSTASRSTEARWFTPRRAARRGVRPARSCCPSRASIARALIEEWAGAPLPGD